jgi:hypothetical protein
MESNAGSNSRVTSSPAGPAGSSPLGVIATLLPETPKTPMKSTKGKAGSGNTAATPTRGSGSGDKAKEPASTDSTITYYSSSSSVDSKGKKRKSPTMTVTAAGGATEDTGDEVQQPKKSKKAEGKAAVTANKRRVIDALATPTPAPKHQVAVSSTLAKLQKGNHDSDSENVSPITVDAEIEALKPLLGGRSWGSGISSGSNEDSYGPSPSPAPRAGSRSQTGDGAGNGTDDDDTIILKNPCTTPAASVPASDAEPETESTTAAALFKEYCKDYDGDDEDSNKENAPVFFGDDDKDAAFEPATPSDPILIAPASTPVTPRSQNADDITKNDNGKGLESIDTLIKSAFRDEYDVQGIKQSETNGSKSSKL